MKSENTNDTVPIDEIVLLAKKLIGIPSVSGNIEASVSILEFIKQTLQGHTFTPFVSNLIPSLLYTNQDPAIQNFRVILNAHLDVVPGSNDQFEPFITDGKLYGRGAYDMKAATAVKIILFQEVANKLSYPLALQLTTDEEIGGVNGTAYQVQNGIRGDFVITGECGSNFNIVHEAKGMLHLKLVAEGKTSHSAYQWLGQNAIMKIYEAISAIHAVYPQLQEEAYATTANVTYIQTTNSAKHTITPAYCEALLDIRYIPSEKDTIVHKLQSILPAGIKSEVIINTVPHITAAANKDIVLLQKIGKAVLNREIILKKQHATSDARHYSGVECDGVEFGPIGFGQHNTEEYVDIQSLENYYRMLKAFLLTIK
jgi:succinyl-diaminopimelate desuccinylase